MSWFMIDVETDGPCPGEYSMIQLGAVVVVDPLMKGWSFFGQLAPISDKFDEEALKVSGR